MTLAQKHTQFGPVPIADVVPFPPDATAVAKLAETPNSETATRTIAKSGFGARNPTAALSKEREDRLERRAKRVVDRENMKKKRDQFGPYGVRITAPYEGENKFHTIIGVMLIAAAWLIDTGGLLYAFATYIASSAFFDTLAGDFWASLPYTTPALFGSLGLFMRGILLNTDSAQKRFQAVITWIGYFFLLILFVAALAAMGANLVPARSSLMGPIAWALIMGHSGTSVFLGAAIALGYYLSRQDRGTQQVVHGEGYARGDGLMRALEAEIAEIDAQLAELERQLAVIAAAEAECEQAWLAELAHVQADLAAVAAQARANRRMTIAAGSPPSPVPAAFPTPSMPSDMTPATVN